MANSEMPWTSPDIATLRLLWAEGHTTAEIGRRMKRTKNGIVGKARRLHLKPRPSPIKGAPTAPTRVSRAKPRPVGSCLPLLSEIATQNMPIIIPAPARACYAAASATKPDALPDLSTDASGPPFRPRPDHPCCFPLGEPKTLTFRYCDAPASAGRPYCAEHAAVAYVRGRDKRPWSLSGAASHG